jgi:uncharacterized membrane protein
MAKQSRKTKSTAKKDPIDRGREGGPVIDDTTAIQGTGQEGSGNLATRGREHDSAAREQAGETVSQTVSKASENIKKSWEQSTEFAAERTRKAEETIGRVTEQSLAGVEKSARATMAATREAMQSMEKTAEELTEKLRDFTRRHEAATVSGTLAEERQMYLGHAAYLLYALGPVTLVSSLFGLLLCYMRLNDEAISGTVLRSHFRWLINSFWLLAGALAVAAILAWILGSIIGGLIALVAFVWFSYRLVKGWLSLYDGKEIAEPNAFW